MSGLSNIGYLSNTQAPSFRSEEEAPSRKKRRISPDLINTPPNPNLSEEGAPPRKKRHISPDLINTPPNPNLSEEGAPPRKKHHISPGLINTPSNSDSSEEGAPSRKKRHISPGLINKLPNEMLFDVFMYATGPRAPDMYATGSDAPEDLSTFYAIQGVCKRWGWDILDGVPQTHWNSILGTWKTESRFPSLQAFAQSIEETIGQRSYFARFHELTKRFQEMGVIPPSCSMLGIQPSYYAKIHADYVKVQAEIQEERDHALMEIWPYIREEIHFGEAPIPATAKEIRLWINDPANSEQIALIHNLSLTGIGLKVLPEEICRFTQLEHLDLTDNALTSLPPAIGHLTRLRVLELQHNLLAFLPPTIGNLTELEQLNLYNNRLGSLPIEIGHLSRLRVLNLRENYLASLPIEISKLSKLRVFNLRENRLASLPIEIVNLSRLQVLNLRENYLISLPTEIGNLSGLQELNLRDNYLMSLPIEIEKLLQLQELNLRENFLTSIPSKTSEVAELDWSKFQGDPSLFISDSKQFGTPCQRNLSDHQLIDEYVRFSETTCQSPLAALYQGIYCGADDEALQAEFKMLSPKIQELIRNKWMAAPFSSSSSSLQSEGNLFANRALFSKAMNSALTEQYRKLSQGEKNMVHWHLWDLAQPSEPSGEDVFIGLDDAIKWGKEHAADNLLRLIAAMERVC